MPTEAIRQAKLRDLESRWQRLNELHSSLLEERDLETRATNRARISQRLAQIGRDRYQVEAEIRQLSDDAPSSPTVAPSSETAGAPATPTNDARAEPLDLFYSYSHADEALRDELEKHLKLLERRGLLRGWHDRRIDPGTLWDETIHERLRTADIVLLLISADFMASDYIWSEEITLAMTRHERGEARVIPVLLRPVDLEGAPFAKLQGLPTDFRPVVSWPNRDEAFLDIAKGIRRVLTQLRPS